MEDEANAPVEMSKHNRPIIREFSSQPFLESHAQSSFFGANAYTHANSGPSTLSMLQGEPSIRDIHSDVSLTHFSTLQPYVNQHLYDVHSIPVSSPLNCVYSPFDEMGNRWLIAGNGIQPDQLGENMSSGDWMSLVDQSSASNNELSLSLSAYSRPPVLNGGSSSQGRCSDMSCSTEPPCHESTGEELSRSSGFGDKSSQFPKMLSQSRYLSVVQEILSEFSSFSLENMDHQLTCSHLDHSDEQGDSFKGSDESSNTTLSLRRRDTEAKKSQLLALLQMLDECYNQCLDEIHTVISAFHAATELDPQTHACFALQTISVLYKSLKERISNQILKLGAYDNGNNNGDGAGTSGASSSDQIKSSFEKSFIQKQWALQQLKRKDQHLWRPQRGLPERSVSVLRAWMFQNFLHPYPKDTEKHLLAIKSGLTRSQVSNWFINARVRLWKPLIEEMYAELNSSRAGKGSQATSKARLTSAQASAIQGSMPAENAAERLG